MAKRGLQERFGAALRSHRESVGISQEALAFEAGIHRTYVSLIERGAGNPTLTVMADLASAVETDLTTLIRETEGR